MDERALLDIQLDENGSVPLWLQLRNRLVFLISSGRLPKGEKLPTVRELAVDLQIHYNTVSKVYQDLEKDGYISSKRGKGTFVDNLYLRNERAADNPGESLADQFIQDACSLGLAPDELPDLVAERVKLMYWSSSGREGARVKAFVTTRPVDAEESRLA